MDPRPASSAPAARALPTGTLRGRGLLGALALLLTAVCLTAPAHAAVQARQRPPDAEEERPPPFAGKDPRDKRAAGRARSAYRKLHDRSSQPLEVWRALGDLGHFDLPSIAEVYLEELDCEEVEHHALARRLIASLSEVDSLEVLLDEGLDHKRPHVRAQVILALGSGRPEVVDWITPTQAALDDEADVVRAAAVESLGLARAQEPFERILELAEDESARVRQQLPETLVRLVHARALPLLRSLSQDKSWRVRSATVRALGQLASGPATEELVAVLERETGRVREDAHQELVALAHVDFGPDAESWRKYFLSHAPNPSGPEPTPARGKPDTRTTVTPLTKATYFDIQVLSQRMVLVIDVSGSMTAHEQPLGNDNPDAEPLSRLDLVKYELQKLVLGFGPQVSLDLVRFSTVATSWKNKLVPMDARHRSAARKELDGFSASGGTNLYEALAVCFDMAQESLEDAALEDESPDTLYVLTDGAPNSPRELLLEYVGERNRELQLRVHCICLASDEVSTGFMRELAELTRGAYANPLE